MHYIHLHSTTCYGGTDAIVLHVVTEEFYIT